MFDFPCKDNHLYRKNNIFPRKFQKTYIKNEESPLIIADERASLKKKWRPPTLPHCIAVPSAQAGLTSLFGMGRGGTPPQ